MIIKYKRAVIGIGMLILFIAAMLVAAISAGVIIRSTGQIQQRTFSVEESSRERLVNRLDILSVDAVGNTTSEQITGFEFLVRLGGGSYDLDFTEMTMTFSSVNGSSAATYFTDNSPSLCVYKNLTAMSRFCFTETIGDGNNVLESGEIVKIFYRLNESFYLPVSEEFDLSFIPASGSVLDLFLETPKVINKPRTKIRT